MPTKETFKVVQCMVETAKASWTVWSQLYSYQTGGHKFAIAIQINGPLFDAISEACQHVTMMNLAELFKGRKDTHCFKTLLEACEAGGWLVPCIADECRNKLGSLKREIKGIGNLRGNYFGHKIKTKKPEDIFKQSGLKIKDIDTLLDAAYFV